MKNDRKIVNMVEIRPHVFGWIVDDANVAGKKLSEYIGDLLELLYNMGGGKKTITEIAQKYPEAKAILAYQDAERKQHLRDIARHMGALYAENPSTEAAEKLQEVCDAAGVAYDEVIKIALADPFSSIVAKTMGKTKIEQCILWITSIFSKYGRIESSKLYTAALKEGYNQRMIYRAKRILLEDPNTPYIDVERDGNEWIYIMKDRDGNEIEAIDPEGIYQIVEPEYPKFIKAFLNTGEPVTIVFSDNDDII